MRKKPGHENICIKIKTNEFRSSSCFGYNFSLLDLSVVLAYGYLFDKCKYKKSGLANVEIFEIVKKSHRAKFLSLSMRKITNIT